MLEGGINHLETSTNHRKLRGERVVGAALHTLIEKYGYKREQFFITSRQGFIGDDSVEGIPPELVVQELIAKHPELEREIYHNRFSLNPIFLKYQLEHTLRHTNLDTIDCLLITNPFEGIIGTLTDSKEYYSDKLARVFELYEKAV